MLSGRLRVTQSTSELPSCRSFFYRVGVWSVLLAGALIAHSQNPVLNQLTEGTEETAVAVEGDSALPTVEAVEAERLEIAPRLEAAQGAATEDTAQQLGITLEALNSRVDRLRALDGLLQQQIGTMQRSAELVASEEDLNREIVEYEARGLSEPPPYNLSFAASLQDAVTSEQRHLEGIKTEIASIEGERESAKERLAEAQRARRAAKEAATQNSDPAATQRLTWMLNRSKLEERFHQAAADARRLRHTMATTELALNEKRLTHLETKAGAVLVHTQFTEAELKERLDEVATRRQAIEDSLPKLRETHQNLDGLRNKARDGLQQAITDEEKASRTAELAMHTLQVETATRNVELAEKKLLLLDTEKQLWERRFAVWQGADDGDLGVWKADATQVLEELKRDREVQESRLLDVRATTLEREKILAEWAGAAEGKRIVEEKIKTLREREAILNGYLSTLLPLEQFTDRLLLEIGRELDKVSLGERWARYRRVASTVWNYEVFAYEDGAVTVRKMVIAFLVLTIGFLFTGKVCRGLRMVLLARTRINENAAAAVEKLFYYLAIILILLYTLNLVNIPLTLFAFFGGAIAIAVGFGAQHIINNFISGFILMLERPIRIGDLVEVDGVHGIIQHVGARSTRLLTSQNIHLLIPNSSLLENTVVNWTLSGEKYCTKVSVGVSYGSPTERVAELILEAAANSQYVLDAPKPQVFFTDFGDNALGFDVHFWIKMRRIMDKRRAESEIRFEIDRLFAANGICIAFPQRDLHLDTTRPLEIRLVKEEEQ